MKEDEALAGRFEAHRAHLRAVAYRMLGSLNEAEDAVQEAWIRLSGADTDGVSSLRGWLTTVVARVCLDMLRSRRSRREEPVGVRLPEPIVSGAGGPDPETEALLSGSVGLALLVVLDSLAPAERLAFVLHDMFGVPFEDIARVVGRSPEAARQLASRARRRVRGAAPSPDPDLSRQRVIVDAFLAASRGGDFDALLRILDPDVVLRADRGPAAPGGTIVIRGARAAADQSIHAARAAGETRAALVNGAAGLVSFDKEGQPFSVLGFTVAHGKIVEIDVLADPERLRALDLKIPG
ncbi:RNA polymerase, sigma-24 subunit, ECF subfamily [Anaeromyxobacter dehalogenans 2CP-1]|uniref:RNA polymerase, sigma-24 subunit, ECF subfamily n=1 Tax=Anaeromyxobacter dehalogenans (strain ATCC BAA-258 / DSM 21875 / 2CP-1) TaxID=455488 RepID=B8JHM3_ANAD2|nr:RNA polymerase sigma factor SigJ [Anaeromyxobacter dehalogenans]ACL66735.1 RNA polymerase, sigma-24 subunit, ECF subfamily [Anaeromyxobacter dehalogenans 2CP-1]